MIEDKKRLLHIIELKVDVSLESPSKVLSLTPNFPHPISFKSAQKCDLNLSDRN